jgi:hypothetical protein
MDRWTGQLSAWIDNELSAGETEGLEEHLLECAECREIARELREVRDMARALTDRPPENDLWPGIRTRIEESRVLDFHAPQPNQPRRMQFSFIQLVAAGLALMLTGAGAAWVALRPAVVPAGPPVAVEITESQPAGYANVASYEPPPALRDRLSELEGALEASRAQLDPQTIAVIEKNLAIVESAVQEAAQALTKDPGNGYLRDHLDRTLQTKVDMLERATAIARAET